MAQQNETILIVDDEDSVRRTFHDWLNSAGLDAVTQHVLGLTERFAMGARHKGYRVISAREPGAASGIVAISSPVHDPVDIQQHLEREHRIITAVRSGRLRISPHLYNTTEEIDRVVELLPRH